MEDRFRVRVWDENEEEMLGPIAVDGPPDTITMQCTGLKDKNGELIFEGDIVKQTNNEPYNGTFPVVWVESSLTYVLKINNELNYHHSADWYEQAEVIGNIYENPELLEAEKKK